MVRILFVWVISICEITANTRHCGESNESKKVRSSTCGILQYDRPVNICSSVTYVFTPYTCPNNTKLNVSWHFTGNGTKDLRNNPNYTMEDNGTSYFLTFVASSEKEHKDYYVKLPKECNCDTGNDWLRLCISMLKSSKTESDTEGSTCKQSTILLSPTSVTSTSTPAVDHTTNKGQPTRSTEVPTENRYSSTETRKASKFTSFLPNTSYTSTHNMPPTLKTQENRDFSIARTVSSVILGTTPTYITRTASSPASIDPKETSEPKSTKKRLYQLTLLLTCGGFVICVAIAVVIAYYRCKKGKYRPRYQPKFNIEEVSEGTFDDQSEHEGKMDNVYAKVHRPNMVKPKLHAAAADGNENQLSECRELNYADLDIEHLQSKQRSRPANQRDDADRTEYVTVDFTGF